MYESITSGRTERIRKTPEEEEKINCFEKKDLSLLIHRRCWRNPRSVREEIIIIGIRSRGKETGVVAVLGVPTISNSMIASL